MQTKFNLEIHLSKAYKFQILLLHQSKQLLRFEVKCGIQEMLLEKRLLEKGQQWKIISANISFSTPEAIRNFNIICQCIDHEIKGASNPYVHPKNRR